MSPPATDPAAAMTLGPRDAILGYHGEILKGSDVAGVDRLAAEKIFGGPGLDAGAGAPVQNDMIAGFDLRDLGADLLHHAATLVAEQVRQVFVGAFHTINLAELGATDSGDFHFDKHLPVAERGKFDMFFLGDGFATGQNDFIDDFLCRRQYNFNIKCGHKLPVVKWSDYIKYKYYRIRKLYSKSNKCERMSECSISSYCSNRQSKSPCKRFDCSIGKPNLFRCFCHFHSNLNQWRSRTCLPVEGERYQCRDKQCNIHLPTCQ